jgi:hypothetical protein
MKRDRMDLRRDDDWLRWDDLAIALITVGSLVAAHMGWI